MRIQIKNRWTLEALFECEADSLRAGIEIAVKRGANLYGTNLRGANLYGADLGGADLYGADLYGANLRGADLGGAKYGGYAVSIEPLQILGLYWRVLIIDDAIKIGCKLYSINQWSAFSDDEIAAMDGRALTFWREHKELILMVARLHARKVVEAA